jgi:hypothetical protein
MIIIISRPCLAMLRHLRWSGSASLRLLCSALLWSLMRLVLTPFSLSLRGMRSSATNKVIGAKDHASVQINVAIVSSASVLWRAVTGLDWRVVALREVLCVV